MPQQDNLDRTLLNNIKYVKLKNLEIPNLPSIFSKQYTVVDILYKSEKYDNLELTSAKIIKKVKNHRKIILTKVLFVS